MYNVDINNEDCCEKILLRISSVTKLGNVEKDHDKEETGQHGKLRL